MNSRPTSEAEALIASVVDNGFCIGCGACVASAPDAVKLDLDPQGRWQASLNPVQRSVTDEVPLQAICPFGQNTPTEDQLAEEFLEAETSRFDPRLGYFHGLYAGYSNDDYREAGSSGGVATRLAAELLAANLIDAVVHVRPSSPDGTGLLFSYAISRSSAELIEGAKSHYHPVEMSKMIKILRATEGRYLIVGVPCFIKSIRNLTRFDTLLRSRVVLTMAIFCGHLKSLGYGQSLAWQMGVAPKNLLSISFREKLVDRPADKYGTKATAADGSSVTTPSSDLFGTDWGLGLFKYKACDYCDDITGETADVSVGDAWLPEYTRDSSGTSVVITRDASLDAFLRERPNMHLEELSVDQVVASQDANYRHRRAGLAYRLHKARRASRWVPPKRVEPYKNHFTRWERRRMDLREEISAQSHRAWQQSIAAADVTLMERQLAPLIAEYRDLTVRRYLPNSLMKRIRQALTSRRRRRGFWSPTQGRN